MKNDNLKLKNLIIFSIIFFGALFFAKGSLAAVNIPWSTTYNCVEWTQGDPTLNCDGIVMAGGWTSGEGHEEQITTAANNPAGGGGRGQRHWLSDARNINSGGTKIQFTSAQPNVWIRFYVRFQPGFRWSGGDYYKIIYINNATSPYFEMDWPHLWDNSQLNVSGTIGGNVSGAGWDTLMVNGAADTTHPGHNVSDGQFHCFEYHFNINTGVWQHWLDGVLKVNLSNVDYKGSTGVQYFLIGSNHSPLNNGADMYVDYDDFAVSNTGYIGPVGGGTPDTTPPSPPTNVTVI